MATVTNFPRTPRREDIHGHMVVWDMLNFLRDDYDRFRASGGGGGGGGATTYIHTQVTPLTTWTVVHSLGRFPIVTVVDSGNSELLADLQYVDVNSLTLTFGASTSGKAYVV